MLLSESQHGEIIGLYKNNVPNHKITKIVGVHRKTVTRTIQNYIDRKDLVAKNQGGRPKLINDENKKILKKLVKQNNRKSAEQIKNKFNEKTSINVSTRTIRRTLHELNIFSRVPAAKPLLNDKQRINRLNWCIERRNWTVRKWKSVVWSDESRFTIYKNDGPGLVWRPPGTRFNIENMTPTVKFGGGGLMMWGCFSGKGLGPLVKVDGNLNSLGYIQILEDHLLPLIENDFNRRGYLYQDDNAPVHTARVVKNWYSTNGVNVLSNWPSQSPDLNPIEHLWSELERRIRKRPKNMTSINELESALQEEWSKITNDVLIKLIESMPRRVEAVIENNGWPTRY
jgi:transposase